MTKRAFVLSLLGGALGWSGCLGGMSFPSVPEGPNLSVNVAALNLQGVGDVVWDIEVDNGASTPQVVWQRRVSSSDYGDGAGSASYVGTCDADPNAHTNTVKVWVVGVYSAPVTTLGTFASGAAGGVSGVDLPFQNPTTAIAPLTRSIVCAENTDVAVHFDVALMRPAQQGFFDIAVSFNNVFCSAKFDCCDDANNNGTCDAGEDIDLLHTAGTGRGRTMVLGFACTGGIDATDDTTLYMDPLSFDCTSPANGFTADFTVSSAAADAGNQCTAGDMAGCAAVTDPDPAQADTYLYEVAVYRGQEQLMAGGAAAHKAYWNVALGVTDQIGACWLRTNATAASTGATSTGFSGGVVAAGAVYPYVHWDVDLGTCASEPLSFDGTGMVQPAYTHTADTADTAFGYAFAPGGPPAPVCWPACDNGGTCTAPGTCACPLGYYGAHCELAPNLGSCEDYRVSARNIGDGDYVVDPDGEASGDPPFTVYCVMSTTPAKAFVTLPAQGANLNYSRMDGTPSPSGCGTVSNNAGATTTYAKLRIDEASRVVTLNDTTFATQSGTVTLRSCHDSSDYWTTTWLNFGFATDSYGAGSQRGSANITLTGTPFKISTASTFVTTGSSAAGGHTLSPDRKVANLTGGGHTGQHYASYLRLDFDN